MTKQAATRQAGTGPADARAARTPALRSERVEPAAGCSGEALYSIGRLSEELGLSARALRFYEAKGLISPQRAGANRIYTRRDRGRLLLILRGKRLGFSLDEIAEYLNLYDAGPSQAPQIRHLLNKVEDARAELERKRADIDSTLAELDAIHAQCLAALDQGRED